MSVYILKNKFRWLGWRRKPNRTNFGFHAWRRSTV